MNLSTALISANTKTRAFQRFSARCSLRSSSWWSSLGDAGRILLMVLCQAGGSPWAVAAVAWAAPQAQRWRQGDSEHVNDGFAASEPLRDLASQSKLLVSYYR